MQLVFIDELDSLPTTSQILWNSSEADLRAFRLVGTLKNKSSTVIWVPGLAAHAFALSSCKKMIKLN
jgi:hypothetical protein